jgi:hypothetical protein
MLAVSWLAQFIPPHINSAMNGAWGAPVIDSVSMVVMVALARWRYATYSAVVFGLTLISQAGSLVYFTTYSMGIDTSEPYFITGCVTFGAQLAIIGFAGAPTTWRRVKGVLERKAKEIANDLFSADLVAVRV